MWVARVDLPRNAGHSCYEQLNRVFDEADCDAFVEERCAKFYVDGLTVRVWHRADPTWIDPHAPNYQPVFPTLRAGSSATGH